MEKLFLCPEGLAGHLSFSSATSLSEVGDRGLWERGVSCEIPLDCEILSTQTAWITECQKEQQIAAVLKEKVA